MCPPDSQSRSAAPLAAELSLALTDLGLTADDVLPLGEEQTPSGALLATVAPGELPTAERLHALQRDASAALLLEGHLLLHVAGRRTEQELAHWRDGLWPKFHVGARYVFDASGGVTRVLLQGATPMEDASVRPGSIRVGELLCARRCEHVRSPALTAQKFDANAAAWNGNPGAADYLHHRWMRRLVARFAPKRDHRRVLDFGCGAGWVGIEASLRQGAEQLRFFDPSPEMIRIAAENAAAAGVDDASGTTGFGEDPPYPAQGEEPFDLVLSSGVLSFARDLDAWYDGLASTVAPDGVLVLGDLHSRSLGMRRRRSKRPLLPIRELASITPGAARAAMEARGFKHEGGSGYQLTDPFPQLIHLDASRLGGVLSHPLSWCNRLASSFDRATGAVPGSMFDSWVMRFTRER